MKKIKILMLITIEWNVFIGVRSSLCFLWQLSLLKRPSFSFLFFSFLFFWDSNLCFFFVCLQSLMHILPHVLNHRSVRFLSSLLENTSFYHHDPQFISLPFLFLNENYIHNLKLFSSFNKYDILLITFNIINFYINKSI